MHPTYSKGNLPYITERTSPYVHHGPDITDRTPRTGHTTDGQPRDIGTPGRSYLATLWTNYGPIWLRIRPECGPPPKPRSTRGSRQGPLVGRLDPVRLGLTSGATRTYRCPFSVVQCPDMTQKEVRKVAFCLAWRGEHLPYAAPAVRHRDHCCGHDGQLVYPRCTAACTGQRGTGGYTTPWTTN